MTVEGRYRNEPQDIVDKIKDLERRLGRLERNPQAQNTAMDQDGNSVALSTIVFGGRGALDSTACTKTYPGAGTSYHGDPTTGNVGPSVTVTIGDSGKCWIMWASIIIYQLDSTHFAGTGSVGVALSGANTQSPDDFGTSTWLTLSDYHQAPALAGADIIVRNVKMGSNYYFTGLTPGATTFKLVYRASTLPVTSFTANFDDRSLFVQPL